MSDLHKRLLEQVPKRVKVGGYRFALDLVDKTDPDLAGDNGSTEFDSLRCAVDRNLPFQNIVNTIIHELNHAINHVYGVKDGSSEEEIACQHANGWLALRIDNLKLDAWLNRAVRELRKSK